MSAFGQRHIKNNGVVILHIFQSKRTRKTPQQPLATTRVCVVANIASNSGPGPCEYFAEAVLPFQFERPTGRFHAQKLTPTGHGFVIEETRRPGFLFAE